MVKSNFKPETLELKNYWNQLALLITGLLLGYIVNHIYYFDDKKFEANISIQKELVVNQFPYLNRILLLTYRNETNVLVTKYVILEGKQLTKTDSALILTLPSFITDDIKKKCFLDDIEYIKTNRGNIDYLIYSKFEELLNILQNNPIPKTSNLEELKISNWNNKKVQKEWYKCSNELFKMTFSKVYQ